GMPTVNLKIASNKLIPRHGVYGTITIVDGVRYLGVTSIGPRPTVDDYPTITIETFLLYFNRDLYGQVITMEIKNFIRPITKFESLQAVREQVDKDVLFVVEKGLE
ncbi:riboflavin kinase, partial [Sphaerochaeta sp.]